MYLTRREFNKLSLLSGAALLGDIQVPPEEVKKEFPVAIVKTADRESGIAKAVGLLGEINFSGKDIYLKGSYNSPDQFPATTHPDALGACVRWLRGKGAKSITLAERSGMGQTRDVLGKLGVIDKLRELDVAFLPLEELPPAEWRHIELAGSHWPNGIEAPSFLLRDDACVVQLCNLKTHRFGGDFSASLKNSIGFIAKYAAQDGRNYMKDLHNSHRQGAMIADVNQIYAPALIVMDAVQTFIDGGPEKGEKADSGIIAAAFDRVALDAVGLAILQHSGAESFRNLENIFYQAQIKRAVELNLGARSPGEIRIVFSDEDAYLAETLENFLKK